MYATLCMDHAQVSGPEAIPAAFLSAMAACAGRSTTHAAAWGRVLQQVLSLAAGTPNEASASSSSSSSSRSAQSAQVHGPLREQADLARLMAAMDRLTQHACVLRYMVSRAGICDTWNV